MIKNKKINLIIASLVLIFIVIGFSAFYVNKVKKDRVLDAKIEEVYEEADNIKILNMNNDEEELYSKLKEDFNKAISSKKLNEANEVLDKLKDLKSSVEKRIQDEAKIEEERKKEEEKQEKENEIALPEEAKKKEEASKVENNTSNSNTQSIAPSNNEPKIANTSVAKNSNQIISVVSTGGSTAELVLWQKDSNGKWYEYDSMFARLGENGMKNASEVYEMDLCTPTGVYSLTEAFGAAQNPGSGVPYRVLDGSEYWVDDVNSPYYNTMQFGAPNGRWNSAEHLIDHSNSYKYSLVIDYNRWTVVPGKSSAIFLHVDVGVPTWGCVAVEQSKMKEILQWINPGSNPKIALALSYGELYSY
ncbi:hypothetical protein UT300007_17640 [Clostridium sp. CTA-7]